MGDSLASAPSDGDVMVRLGGVLSRLTFTLAVAPLPARSVAVPEATWFSPSLLIVTGGAQLSTPDPASEQVKLTVTSVLFQPLAFASGERVAVMMGPDLSMWTVTLVDAWFPARSTAVPETVCVPSAITVTGSGQVATCERLSAHENVTVTSLLFQPLALGGGTAVAAIVGGVLSMLTVTLVVAV